MEASFSSYALITELVLNSNYINSKEGGTEPEWQREKYEDKDVEGCLRHLGNDIKMTISSLIISCQI
jgi:hypothetical protein